ncbi:MAG: hypothetical protein QXS01_04270 [Candidatus Bathyarchaeia archaeon]
MPTKYEMPMYEEIPMVKGMHNDYMLIVTDDVTGEPFHLAYVKSIKVGFYKSPDLDTSSLAFLGNATVDSAPKGRIWIQVTPEQTQVVSSGEILYLSAELEMFDGQIIKVPIPPQIVKVIER